MENFSVNESWNKIKNELEKKISFAKEHFLSEEEFENIMAKEIKINSIRQKRELTDKEIRYFIDFRKKLNEANIRVETLPEAKKLMEIFGINPDVITSTLQHENAHANKGEQLGAEHLGYNFFIISDNNGNFLLQPSVSIKKPIEWSKEKNREVSSKIALAPDQDYGKDEISNIDKMYLE